MLLRETIEKVINQKLEFLSSLMRVVLPYEKFNYANR